MENIDFSPTAECFGSSAVRVGGGAGSGRFRAGSQRFWRRFRLWEAAGVLKIPQGSGAGA